jgi:hypothetical protein
MVSRLTWTLALGHGGHEGHEAGTAKELGNKDGGISLSLGIIYPTYALSKNTILAASLSKNSTAIAAHCSRIF